MEPNTIVIGDPLSVDIDDLLAVALFGSEMNIVAFLAVHFRAKQRAQAVSWMLHEMGWHIPVHYHEEPDDEFHAENPLFPAFFGDPVDPTASKQWYPDFGKAFPAPKASSIDVKNNALEVLLLELHKHSPKNPLHVVCMGPMHILAKVPASLYPNMRLFTMGAGVYKIGYNWGIAPKATQTVLLRLSESNTYATVISAEYVKHAGAVVPPKLHAKWVASDESYPLVRALIAEWNNSLKGNALADHKNLCDPLTLLASTQSPKDIRGIFALARVNPDCPVEHYLQEAPYDTPLIEYTLAMNPVANVLLVTSMRNEKELCERALETLGSIFMGTHSCFSNM